jgi:hypothetical protein
MLHLSLSLIAWRVGIIFLSLTWNYFHYTILWGYLYVSEILWNVSECIENSHLGRWVFPTELFSISPLHFFVIFKGRQTIKEGQERPAEKIGAE